MKINGIQQLGVGVTNFNEAWQWYRKYFSMDILIFDEEADAKLMLAHTDGKTVSRHALLSLNMQGGGGFEIWQHTGKDPEEIEESIILGDLGINIGVIKTNDIDKAFKKYKQDKLNLLGDITLAPCGSKHFYLKDPYGNLWEIKEHQFVFRRERSVNGGVLGTVIGVEDIEKSLVVYKDLLGYDKQIFDETKVFKDFSSLPGGNHEFRRIILQHSKAKNGALSPFFGPSQIELIEVKNRKPKAIYENRIWGDPGFIHLCFDINNMVELREKAKKNGFPFTVDSAKAMDTFDMGDTAGNFAYIQAPEGTLIEFVETHKIPLVKKIGWYINLRKRGNDPLPIWLLKLFRFKRVK